MHPVKTHSSGEGEKKIDIISPGVFASGFSLHPDAQPAVHIGGKYFYEDGIIEDPQNPGEYLIALVTKEGEILQCDNEGIPFAKVISGPVETSLGRLVQLRQTPKTVPLTKGTQRKKIDAWYEVKGLRDVDVSSITSELGKKIDPYESYRDERESWGERITFTNGVGYTAVGELSERNRVFYRGENPFVVELDGNQKLYVQSIHRNFILPGIGKMTQFSGARNGGGFGKQMFFDANGKQVRFDVDRATRYMTGVLFVGKHGTLISLEGDFEVFLPYNTGTTNAIAGNSGNVKNALDSKK